jgi:hypothetical protein
MRQLGVDARRATRGEYPRRTVGGLAGLMEPPLALDEPLSAGSWLESRLGAGDLLFS